MEVAHLVEPFADDGARTSRADAVLRRLLRDSEHEVLPDHQGRDRTQLTLRPLLTVACVLIDLRRLVQQES